MKTSILLILIMTTSVMTSLAKSDKPKQKVCYARISPVSGHRQDGILYDVTDTSVMLLFRHDSIPHEILYSNIEKIDIRTKGKVGRGIVIGAGSGLVTGTLFGVAAYHPAPSDQNSFTGFAGSLVTTAAAGMLGGLLGSIAGGCIGAAAGSDFNEKLTIAKDRNQFNAAIPTIKKYCLKK